MEGKEARFLGIDYGLERTGLALAIGSVILPVATLSLSALGSRKQLLDAIAALAREKAAQAIVMGLPLLADNSETETSIIVRNAADRLKRRLPGLPFHFVPEFLTTQAASSHLKAIGLRRPKIKAVRDQAAACHILSSFLNQQSSP